MNKYLTDLENQYVAVIQNQTINIQVLKKLCKERERTYTKLKAEDNNVLLDDVVTERAAFWAVPYGILCNCTMTDSRYIKVLSLITDNDPSLEVLDKKGAKKILELDQTILTDIRTKLKIHPRQSGRKISDINDALNNIKYQLDELTHEKM